MSVQIQPDLERPTSSLSILLEYKEFGKFLFAQTCLLNEFIDRGLEL